MPFLPEEKTASLPTHRPSLEGVALDLKIRPAQMQRLRAPHVLAFASTLLWSLPAGAHAGGAEAAPIVGGAAGFIAGIIVGAIPIAWRRSAVLATFVLLLSPIVYLIFNEPGFPSNMGAAFAGWLALGFAFFLVPAGLLGLAGYAFASWVRRAVLFYRRHGKRPQA